MSSIFVRLFKKGEEKAVCYLQMHYRSQLLHVKSFLFIFWNNKKVK